MKRLKRLAPALLAVALVLAVAAAFGISTEPGPTDAQSGSPNSSPTAAPAVPPADGIVVRQPRPGQGEVVVYWNPGDSPVTARVAYVNLSRWLREATGASQWSDAIRWTPVQRVGTQQSGCSGGQCPRDSALVSGLTQGDTYVFTVVKSPDGVTGLVWPTPVWRSFVPTAALPTMAPTPTPTSTAGGRDPICNTPFAALFPQCGGAIPPTAAPTPVPTPTPTSTAGSGDPICNSPFAALFPQCR